MAVKTKYRYLVTDVTGKLFGSLVPGQYIIETHDMGDEHTWTVIDLKTGEVSSTFTGRYVGQQTLVADEENET